MDTQQFIQENLCADVNRLALGTVPAGVDLKYALTQISGHQSAQHKLPRWAACDGIVYPSHLSMEQCTNQRICQFKADWVSSLLAPFAEAGPTLHFADLTGGFGADCTYLSEAILQLCPHAACWYNDVSEELCRTVANNFIALGLPQIKVSQKTAQEFLQEHDTERFDLIYMDPSRRNRCGGKVVSISDCQPNAGQMQDILLEHSHLVMIKLSPMLDITRITAELKHVMSVTAISLDAECKELLVLMGSQYNDEPLIRSVNIDSVNGPGVLIEARLSDIHSKRITIPETDILPGSYLYEPFACHMKSGLFQALQERYGVWQPDISTHLFLSGKPVEDFPGRCFRIDTVIPADRHSLKQFFSGVPRANISVRNFPMTAAELKHRYKVQDGGCHYIFAITSAREGRMLLDCSRFADAETKCYL